MAFLGCPRQHNLPFRNLAEPESEMVPGDVPAGGFHDRHLHSEAARDGGTDLCRIQFLAFDLAGLDHVGGQRLEHRFLAKLESQRFHVADEAALLAADGGEWFGQLFPVPAQNPGGSRSTSYALANIF